MCTSVGTLTASYGYSAKKDIKCIYIEILCPSTYLTSICKSAVKKKVRVRDADYTLKPMMKF